jgi:hypothetical protein
MLCLLPGTARASMFSVEVTPFPTSGVYVPVIGQYRDTGNPLMFYDFLFGAPFAQNVDPGIEQYNIDMAALSMTTDPFDAGVIGIGAMGTTDLTGGVFATCLAFGCTPSPEDGDWSVYPQFTIQDVDTSNLLFRADPGAGPGRQSTGVMTVTGDPGDYQISSFFDIFFEMCIDFDGCDGSEGDEAWSDLPGSVHYELFALNDIPEAFEESSAVPEPGTLVLFGSGLLVAARGVRSRVARKASVSPLSPTATS